METKLINEIRRVRQMLANAELGLIDSHSEGKTRNLEEQIVHMIETYPEIFGKGGTMRTWLERKAEEMGIDGDFGLPSDFGPYNQNNE